mgnify:CR=1 FL=1
MKEETLSKRVAHSLLLLSLVHVAGVAMPPVAAAATELVNGNYTSSIPQRNSGEYTVTAGDVTLDASGYTGSAQRPLFTTSSGAVKISVADGKTLTLKGFNNNDSTRCSVLYASKQGSSSGVMTFTGGNIIVSNEVTNSHSDVYGLYADNGGKFDFKSDGGNKIDLTILMPQQHVSTHRRGIGLHDGSLAFDGGNFVINITGYPGADSIDRRVGITMSGGSDLNVKADNILIETSETALEFSYTSGNNSILYGVNNTAKFEADSIVFKGESGIEALDTDISNHNSIEFAGSGSTAIYAVGDDASEGNIYGEIIGGKAIDVQRTDITFNNDALLVGQNLTAQGTAPGHWVNEGTKFEYWQDSYWLKTVSLTKDSHLVANQDFILESNGGYDNTALYLWNRSQAQFNGKTNIIVKNGIDTAGAVYVYGAAGDPTKAEFNDDLTISTAGSSADYLYGFDVRNGGQADIAKGLFMNDNDAVTWSLFASGTDSKIDVNSSGSGEVQVVGDVGGYNGGVVNMNMHTNTSYLTAASYINGNGEVNFDISNSAVWNMTGSSWATDLNITDGIVDLRADKNRYSNLTAANLAGSGGIFKMDIDVRSMESDKLYITDDFSGTQAIDIYQKDEYVPQEGSTEGIGLVLASVNGSGVFTAHDREGTLFYTHYDLAHQASATAGYATDWYLDKIITLDKPTTSVETVTAAGALNYHTWRNENDKLLKRMGELRHNGADEKGAWFRVKGSKIGRDGKFAFENKYTTYELGYDELTKKTATKTRYQGAAISYTDGSSSYQSGSGDNSSKAISFYNTELGNKGHYLDVVLKFSHMDNDFKVYDTANNKITGSIENTGVALSAEYGRKKNLDKGWYIEPQAQFTLGYLGGDNYRTSNGIEVSQSGIKSAVGRIGFNLGKEVGSKGIVYAKANLLHEFGGGYETTLTDSSGRVRVSENFDDTWFEYGIGAAFKTGKNNHIYFDIERSTGSDFKKDWQWNAGARWTF